MKMLKATIASRERSICNMETEIVTLTLYNRIEHSAMIRQIRDRQREGLLRMTFVIYPRHPEICEHKVYCSVSLIYLL